jgi:hypothetical protein
MGNVNNTVNYLGNIYPIYKLTDIDPYKTFYFIYCEKVDIDNDIKPITFNVNGIKKTLDNWYNVEYIEVINENQLIVKAVENKYFVYNTNSSNNIIKCDNEIYSLLFNCPYCNKQFYHQTRQSCKDCPNNENKINKKYYYYLVSTNKIDI